MRRLALLVLLLAVAVALPFLIWGEAVETALSAEATRALLAEHGALAWAVAVGLLVADLLLPVPTTSVMAALGMVYGPVLGGAVAAAGSTLAGLVGYGVGRGLGRPAVHRLMGPEATEAGERLFARAGGWIVALSRWAPILPEVVSCVAGVSRMRFPRFLVALLCGSVPLGFAFAAVGHLGAEAPALTLAASALLPALLWPLARRALRMPAPAPDRAPS